MATSFRLRRRHTRSLGTKIRRDLWSWVKSFWASRTQIRIEEIRTPSGAIAWYAHDPRTGRSRYAESSAEIVAWLEK